MPRAEIRVSAEFCASFRLEIVGASDEENRAAFGACFSENFHGHNYLAEFRLEGEIDPRCGMVADYAVIDRLIQEHIIEAVDHRNLNLDVDFLAGIIPTSENLCVAFWQRLAAVLPDGVRLGEIHLRESRDHAVVYRGPSNRK